LDFQTFIEQIKIKLTQPLPGEESHKRVIRKEKFFSEKTPDIHTRNSAVLLVFYPIDDEIYFPLILRPPYDGQHGGQMAFPGGKMELSDENLERTALRETQEEIGIKALDINIIGELTEVYIHVSNYLVKPYVGFVNYKPEFFPDPKEVADIYHLNLRDVLSRKNQGTKNIIIGNREIEVQGLEVENQWVWGATALIINELIEAIS
jgi:8-oxo-dGTP pyrophosphatase MutT (NUDIX family)